MSAGIYLHIPFCKSRCSYCDFATDIWMGHSSVGRYVDTLCREIDHACLNSAKFERIDTIYFGGGTPSLMTPHHLEKILALLWDKFDITADAEITMEMNPATVTPETLAAYRSIGVNRTSFGVQTFDDRALKLLARAHDSQDARDTFSMLRRTGFDNVSFDLIAGLPGQMMSDWLDNLRQAIDLGPDHLSLYLLEVHEGTPLAKQIWTRRRPEPDEDLAAAMYEMMIDIVADAGFEQYEISNFAKAGRASRHNSKYWTLDPVYGFGVSAHSFDGRTRYSNERDTAKYVEMIETTGMAEVTREEIDQRSEFIFLGLRLETGINLGDYASRFGVDLRLKFEKELADLGEAGLVEVADGHLRLTRQGKLFSNEVFTYFV